MTSANPDTLPTPRDPCGPCPRCGRISNFAVDGGTQLSSRRHTDYQGPLYEVAAFLTCNGCGNATVVVTENHGVREINGLHWYPAPGAGDLDRQVHPGVASCYDEGMRCLGIKANRAAAVMFRSALHLFVKDKGDARARDERHLKSALRHMKESHHLHSSLWEWADHLNQLGNEAAHPEDYDDVTADEANTLGDFVRHLIRHEYEMPAQLLRARGLLAEDEPDHSSEDAVLPPGLSGGLTPEA